MIYPKRTKWQKGIPTNGSGPEEFKQKHCSVKYEQKL